MTQGAPPTATACHVLVLRFSALGDVAMSVPVLDAVARSYPHVRFTMVSRPMCRALFAHMPPNVHFVGVDLKRQYHGLAGLIRLCGGLAELHPTAVADLHDVLRTQWLRRWFRLSGCRVAHIRKGRAARRALTRSRRKQRVQLPTSFERYARVFAQLGYGVEHIGFSSVFSHLPGGLPPVPENCPDKGAEKWVGVAPFAAHAGKIYPLPLMWEVLRALAARPGVRLFLFGGGAPEVEQLEKWSRKLPAAVCVPRALHTLADELALMAHIDVMLTMDSANMHLASLAGTRVISLWGATHPLAGFMGWRQNPADALQTDLPCRPCSVFGNKPCARGDYACLTRISPSEVAARVLAALT